MSLQENSRTSAKIMSELGRIVHFVNNFLCDHNIYNKKMGDSIFRMAILCASPENQYKRSIFLFETSFQARPAHTKANNVKESVLENNIFSCCDGEKCLID